jgi:hypothetical protein
MDCVLPQDKTILTSVLMPVRQDNCDNTMPLNTMLLN